VVQPDQYIGQVSRNYPIQYDEGVNILGSLTFQWLAIPFVQHELDLYTTMHNTTTRRSNKHKVLPHGIPQQMFQYPSTVDSYDFKV
jgi:hypothetical protein